MSNVSPEFYWAALAVVIVLSSARLTRLVTFDAFPPILYLRNKYADVMDRTDKRRGWVILAYCPWCASFWITLGVIVWGDLAGVFDNAPVFGEWMTHLWWIANGLLGGSYLAAMVMVHDGDDSEGA